MTDWLNWQEVDGKIEASITYEDKTSKLQVEAINGLYHINFNNKPTEAYSTLADIRKRIRSVYRDLRQEYRKCQQEEQERETKKTELKKMLIALTEEEQE